MKKKLSVLVVAFLALVLAFPVLAENAKTEKATKWEEVVVPDGYVAVVAPGGRSYVLLPGSPDDFIFAENGRTILQALTDDGQRILDAAKLSFVAERTAADVFTTEVAGIEPVYCEGSYECGKLLCNQTKCQCATVTGCSCSYWYESCRPVTQ